MTKLEYREKQRDTILLELKKDFYVTKNIKENYQRILFMIDNNIYNYDADERRLSREYVTRTIGALQAQISNNIDNCVYLRSVDLNLMPDNSIITLPQQFSNFPTLRVQVS